jgi:hypothetical protein
MRGIRHKYKCGERQCFTLSFKHKIHRQRKKLNLDPRNIALVVFEWKMQDVVKQSVSEARREEEEGASTLCVMSPIVPPTLWHTSFTRVAFASTSAKAARTAASRSTNC